MAWNQPTAGGGAVPASAYPLLGPADSAAAPNYSWSADPNTGMYSLAADEIGFSTGGVRQFRMVNPGALYGVNNTSYLQLANNTAYLAAGVAGLLTLTNTTLTSNVQSLGQDGTAAAPAYAFASEATMGMYRSAAGTLALTADGTNIGVRLNASSTYIFSPAGVYIGVTGTVGECSAAFRVADGTALAPSYTFSNDADTGMYSAAGNTIGFATMSTLRASIDTAAFTSTLPFLAPDGTAAAPAYSFSSDANAGFYMAAANTLEATVNAGTSWWQLTAASFRVSHDIVLGGTLYQAGGVAPIIGSLNSSGIFKSADAGNQSTTVGAAGAASALPANPLGYFIAQTAAGTSVKVPYYTAA